MPNPTKLLAFYTPHQVADLLHVHYRTVLDWIATGDLGAVDLSDPNGSRNRYAITQDQLDAFIAARTRS